MGVYTDWVRPLTNPYADSFAGADKRPVYAFDVDAQARYDLDVLGQLQNASFEVELGRHLIENDGGFVPWTQAASTIHQYVVYPFPVDVSTINSRGSGYIVLLADYGQPPEWTLGSRKPLFQKPRVNVVIIGGVDSTLTSANIIACRVWNIMSLTWAMEIPGRIRDGGGTTLNP